MNEQDQKIVSRIEELTEEYNRNPEILLKKTSKLLDCLVIGMLARYDETEIIDSKIVDVIDNLIRVKKYLIENANKVSIILEIYKQLNVEEKKEVINTLNNEIHREFVQTVKNIF